MSDKNHGIDLPVPPDVDDAAYFLAEILGMCRQLTDKQVEGLMQQSHGLGLKKSKGEIGATPGEVATFIAFRNRLQAIDEADSKK